MSHVLTAGELRAADSRPLSDAALAGLGAAVALLSAYTVVGYTIMLVGFLVKTELFPPDWLDFAAIGLCAATGLAVAACYRAGRLDAVAWAAAASWEQAVVRYTLAHVLVGYGFAKLAGEQFTSGASTLDTPLGDVSGLQLTWRFFGYSFVYTAFVAAGQVVGSALLLSRRLATLGAMVLLPIVTNIVIINFTHEIPVRLFASILLVMVLSLLLADAGRLRAVFLENAPAPARDLGGARTGRVAALRWLAILFVFVFNGLVAWQGYVEVHARSPLDGVWEVSDFTLGGERRAPDADEGAWRRVYFEQGGVVAVRTGARRPEMFLAEFDEAASTVKLTAFRSETEYTLGYERLEDGGLRLAGGDGPGRVDATLRRAP
jgi:hypothetical protein